MYCGNCGAELTAQTNFCPLTAAVRVTMVREGIGDSGNDFGYEAEGSCLNSAPS